METRATILDGISNEEKGAYLSAIASIATADTQATETEIDYLVQLCEAADLPNVQQQLVLQAAQSTDEQLLLRSLDLLKSSDLRFSLITDLFAFAKSDGNYSETEQKSVEKIATYLGIDETQYGLLNQLADKTSVATSEGKADQPQLQSAFGLGDKLQASGINAGSLIKGLISIAAPLILAKMMGRRSGGLTNTGSGGLPGGGGLGSLIGMLGGGRGMGGLGSMLGKMFR